MTPRQEEIAEAVARHGSHRKAAAALGIDHSAIDRTMAKLRRDPAWHEQAKRIGFDPLHAGWLKVPPQDGQPGASVYVRPDRQEALAGIREALEAYEGRAEPSPLPSHASADLLNAVFLPDWHMGLHSWGRETGADYSTKIAANVLAQTTAAIVPRLPPAGVGVIIAPGDVLHANDARNVTPKSGHRLDVDGRMLKVMETAAASLMAAVDLMREHHERVELVILSGNHDEDAALMLALALRLYFAREDRVTVHDGAGLWWVREHGDVMLCATHGHQVKQAAMGPFIAAEYAPAWGRTRHRFAFSGHIHHERVREFPGVLCEALRPITARDAYAAGAYQSQREISAMTFHRTRGRIGRIYEAIA